MKVLVAGDFSPWSRLEQQISKREFGDIFPQDLVHIIEKSDFAIVNFESSIPATNSKPIHKVGPNLCTTENAVDAVSYAGFNIVTLANNHINDYGGDALLNTIDLCKQKELKVVGAGENIDKAKQILYVDKDGTTLAIINCCESEFSIATNQTPGANPLNPIQQYYSIKEAREKADFVLVIVHGGHEHYQLPSIRMQETYRFFIDSGADVVINHHQHCFSGYEIYQNRPIFYGLGNFCFDDNPIVEDSIWNKGFLVEIDFSKDISYKIYPYIQYSKEANVHLLPESSFNDELAKINSIICSHDKLIEESDKYYEKTINSIISKFEPFNNRFVSVLRRWGLFPKYLNNNILYKISNVILCESHRDKFIYYFSKINNGNE